MTRFRLALWMIAVMAVGAPRALVARARAWFGCALIDAGARVLGSEGAIDPPPGLEARIMARVAGRQCGERGGAT